MRKLFLTSGSMITLSYVVLILFLLSVSVFVNYALGFYTVTHNEEFIPFFLGPESLLYKIFYYPVTDYYYRAREITNIFQYLDTAILLWSAKAGVVHLLSGVHYFLLFLLICIASILIRFNGKSKRPQFIFLLLSFAYLTSPAVFLTGFYFRPAKILVGTLGALSIFVFFVFLQVYRKHQKVFLVTFFLLSIAMSLTDEIGIVFSLAIILFACLGWLVYKRPAMKYPFIGFGIGMLGAYVYREIVGPLLVKQYTGLATTVWGPEIYGLDDPSAILTSINLSLQYIQYFFGNIPRELIFIPLLCVVILIFPRILSYKIPVRLLILGISTVFLWFVAQTIILHFMAVRHPVITWPEYAVIYYPLPFYTFYFALLVVLAIRFIQKMPHMQYLLSVCFLVWIIGNCIALPYYISLLLAKDTKTSVYYKNFAPGIIESIRNYRRPLEDFNLEHMQTAKIVREMMNK